LGTRVGIHTAVARGLAGALTQYYRTVGHPDPLSWSWWPLIADRSRSKTVAAMRSRFRRRPAR